MGGELLEAYRRIEHRQYLMVVCLTISTIVTLALLIMYAQLVKTSTDYVYRYLGSQANYSSLVISSSKQVASLQQAVTGLSVRYNETEYNLTTPYTRLLYSNYGVNIPGRAEGVPSTAVTNRTGPVATFNTTYQVRYNTYNFTVNAPYPGYLLLNATSTGVNTRSSTGWEFLVSGGRLIDNATLDYYDFEAGTYYQSPYSPIVTTRGTYRIDMNASRPYSVYAPLPSSSSGSVKVPVDSGTVRIWIVNFANRSITATFSAEYVGFRNH